MWLLPFPPVQAICSYIDLAAAVSLSVAAFFLLMPRLENLFRRFWAQAIKSKCPNWNWNKNHFKLKKKQNHTDTQREIKIVRAKKRDSNTSKWTVFASQYDSKLIRCLDLSITIIIIFGLLVAHSKVPQQAACSSCLSCLLLLLLLLIIIIVHWVIAALHQLWPCKCAKSTWNIYAFLSRARVC